MAAISRSPNPARFSVLQEICRQLAELLHAGDAPQLGNLAELLEEPRVDVRQLVQLLDGPAALERLEQRPHAPVVRHDQLLAQRRVVLFFARLRQQHPLLAELERSHALEERLLERAPDRHRLAHRLHLRRQRAIGLRELLEVPPRNLRHDVVDRRLERRRGEPRDVVGNLVEVIAERELGGDLRDRETGRLRRQRRRPRDARVHLDDQHAAVFGVHAELDVRSAGLDADPVDDAPRGVAHALIFLVGQRQRGRHGDAVAGMHAHRIDVLDRADDDEVVCDVAHHLELELLPADDGLFDEQLVNRAHLEAAIDELAELFDVVGDAAADAAHRERRPDDGRKSRRLDDASRLVDRSRQAAGGRLDADLFHRVAEEQAIFAELDGVDVRADQLHAVLIEHAGVVQRDGKIQRGLSADGRQNRVGPLLFDDLRDGFDGERLDVGAIGHLRIRHDGRRIAVDEDDVEPFGPQRLARLRARIVELARLPDDDRAGADDENALEVFSSRHYLIRMGPHPHALPSLTLRILRRSLICSVIVFVPCRRRTA